MELQIGWETIKIGKLRNENELLSQDFCPIGHFPLLESPAHACLLATAATKTQDSQGR